MVHWQVISNGKVTTYDGGTFKVIVDPECDCIRVHQCRLNVDDSMLLHYALGDAIDLFLKTKEVMGSEGKGHIGRHKEDGYGPANC